MKNLNRILFCTMMCILISCSNNAPKSTVIQTDTSYFNSGCDKFSKGDTTGANKDFEKTIELNPKHANAYCNLGVIKYNHKDYWGAIEFLDKAIEIDPKVAKYYEFRAFSKSVLSNFDGAKEDLKKALELDPKNIETYNTDLANVDQKKAELEKQRLLLLEEQEKYEKTKAGKIWKKHPWWSKEDCERIANKEYWIGMSYDMLVCERGQPNSKNPSNFGNGTSWQWCWHYLEPSCFYDENDDGNIDSYN